MMTCSMCHRDVEPGDVFDRIIQAECKLCEPAGIKPAFTACACGRCSDQGFNVYLARKQHQHIYHQRRSTAWCWDSRAPGERQR